MNRQKYFRFSNMILDEMISKAKYEINLSNYPNISKISAGIRLFNCILGEFLHEFYFNISYLLLLDLIHFDFAKFLIIAYAEIYKVRIKF